MENDRAKELLDAEIARVTKLLHDTTTDGRSDRAAANDDGDLADPAERLTAEAGDDAIASGLTDRLAALERAERRLAEGTYGRSIESGLPIPDERLEADPAAERTVEEAERA